MDLSVFTKEKKELLNKKRKTQQEIKDLIEKIKKMDLESYLRYLKKEDEEEDNEEEENEEETENASIQNILELKIFKREIKTLNIIKNFN